MWRRGSQTALLAVVTSAIVLPLSASAEVWKSNGPYFASMQGIEFAPAGNCGYIRSVAADGSMPSEALRNQSFTADHGQPTIYAATSSGVWATCGGSGKWTSLGAVIYGASVAVDPTRPYLYVAGSSYARGTGLLRSTDGGASWQVPQSGLPFAYYNTVRVHPTRPATVLVGGVGGLYRSTDFGANWKGVLGIDTSAYISSLAVNATVPNMAFASGSGGVYRSIDSGRSWTLLSGGLPAGAYSPSVAIHSAPNRLTVYAAVNGSIWRSFDRGTTWAMVDGFGLPAGYVQMVAVDPSPFSPAILYAQNYVFSSGLWSVFRSADGGGTWAPADPSLPANDAIQSIAVNPATPSTVYATSTTTGLHTSWDSGQTWVTTNRQLSGTLSRVAVAPSAPQTVYAGSYDSGPFKSTDGGRSWVAINRGLGPDVYGTDMSIQSLAVSPINPAMAYVGTCCGVYRTVNGGASWVALNDGMELLLPQVQALAIAPTAPNMIYAGTLFFQVWKTTDGHTWSSAGNGLADVDPYASVYAIAIDPHDPNTVYASTYSGSEGPPDTRVGYGVFKSIDGGAHWVPVNTGLTNLLVRTLAVDPANPMTVYAGTSGSGIFKSVNGGASWAASGTGAGLYPSTIVVDPLSTSTVYASTYDAGVFRSTNFGLSWTPINHGLDVPTTSAQWLAIDPTAAGQLYLATFMFGVAVLQGGNGNH
jgi:photosystem II stability/assembly factor-like uncharacterized protein